MDSTEHGRTKRQRQQMARAAGRFEDSEALADATARMQQVENLPRPDDQFHCVGGRRCFFLILCYDTHSLSETLNGTHVGDAIRNSFILNDRAFKYVILSISSLRPIFIFPASPKLMAITLTLLDTPSAGSAPSH